MRHTVSGSRQDGPPGARVCSGSASLGGHALCRMKLRLPELEGPPIPHDARAAYLTASLGPPPVAGPGSAIGTARRAPSLRPDGHIAEIPFEDRRTVISVGETGEGHPAIPPRRAWAGLIFDGLRVSVPWSILGARGRAHQRRPLTGPKRFWDCPTFRGWLYAAEEP